jgi:hypothetical protein
MLRVDFYDRGTYAHACVPLLNPVRSLDPQPYNTNVLMKSSVCEKKINLVKEQLILAAFKLYISRSDIFLVRE